MVHGRASCVFVSAATDMALGFCSSLSSLASPCYAASQHGIRVLSHVLAAASSASQSLSQSQQQTRRMAEARYAASQQEDSHVDAVPEKAGRIHSVDSFSAVDGPGVRMVVFEQVRSLISTKAGSESVDQPCLTQPVRRLTNMFFVFVQGCAMRCKFCSNPDTWSPCAGEVVSSKDIAAQLRRWVACIFVTVSNGGRNSSSRLFCLLLTWFVVLCLC